MELSGSSYLLNLAVISITFAGFSTIAFVFLQAQSAGVRKSETFLIRTFIRTGLLVTIFSIAPPLLGALGMAPSWIWRLSSIALALSHLRGVILYLRQRSHAMSTRIPMSGYIFFIISIGIILSLFINTIGIVIEPNAGLYELGATWLLVESMLMFVIRLDVFLQPIEKD